MTSCFLVLLLLLITVSGEESNGIRRLRRVQVIDMVSDGTPIKVGCTTDTTGGDTGCNDGQYCKKDNGECLTKNFGTCETKSQICPMMYMPVCGCDGQTYGNSCTASGAGQSVAYMGECQGNVVIVDIHGGNEPMIIESMSMTEEPMSLIIDGIINGGSMSMNIDDESMSFPYNEIPSLLPDVNIYETIWMAHYIDLDVDIVAPITLEFDSESIHGSSGCNSYNGRVFNLTDVSFTTNGYFATTRMYCGEEGVMEQEDAFLNFLQDKTFSYKIDDTHLNLKTQNGAKAQFVADLK